MAINETLNLIIQTKHRGDGAKKATRGLDRLQKAAGLLAGAFAAVKGAQFVVDLAKVGAESRRQAASLNNLAAAAGESGEAITAAIREASQFTISRMDAMAAANRAMVMDVAKTPAEFERLTKVAVALGRAMGQDATKSIDDFVTAGARQSKAIADNLGLVVGVEEANIRYAKALGVTVEQLTDAERKQAFLNMMLEEGEKKMAELGETTLDSAAKIEQANAAWDDTKVAVGEAAVTLGETTGAMGFLSETANNVTADLNTARETTWNWQAALASLGGLLKWNSTIGDEYRASLERQAEGQRRLDEWYGRTESSLDQYNRAIEEAAQAQDTAAFGALELARAEETAAAAVGAGERWNQYAMALQMTEQEQAATAASALELEKAQAAAALAAGEATKSQLSLAASLKDATDAQVAQAAISQLGAALAEGDITLDQYNTAVNEVQIAFGLATPESMALAEGIAGLTARLGEGTLHASGYDEALSILIGTTTDAATQTGQLKDQLAALPEKKTITIEVRRTGGGLPSLGAPSPGLGGDTQALGTGFAMGGTALVGERGPELVQLPRGSRVHTAGATRQMMRGAGTIVNIGPVNIASNDPEVIWRQLERRARLRNKSAWGQMGR
jgi:hypothetical protein